MRYKLHRFSLILILATILITLRNCKEQPAKIEPPPVARQLQTNSKTIKELASFADLVVSDSTDIRQLMSFRKIDQHGIITDSDPENVEQLFKSMANSKPPANLPIVEIKNANSVILAVGAKGFAAAIWSKILVDRSTGEILKIEFDHKAESDGYGAGITRKSFGEQFVGASMDSETNPFGLLKNGQIIIEGKQKVDGIAGATTTSTSAVNMLNEGLQKYSKYLRP